MVPKGSVRCAAVSSAGRARSPLAVRPDARHKRFALKRDGFSSNRHPALGYCWSMMFSDLPSPAEASSTMRTHTKGFAQAGNRHPPRIKCGAGFFGIML
jgi:hypothetical protein